MLDELTELDVGTEIVLMETVEDEADGLSFDDLLMVEKSFVDESDEL